jgi:asparagine synthase (glutamine-hydrolysing)
MQWTSGWFPFADSVACEAVPRGGIAESAVNGAIWSSNMGATANRIIKSRDSLGQLSIFGQCYATDSEIEDSLHMALNGDFTSLRMWPGQYLSIVERSGETVVIGDLSGVTPVYYVDRFFGCLWASAATPLAAITGARIDWSALLGELAATGYTRFLGRVPFEGVMVVPPGSLLRLSSMGASVQAWYEPAQQSKYADGAERFRAALLASVNYRAASAESWSCDFSGGVDSSTLAVLAACLKFITAITTVNPWLSREDVECAQTIAREYHTRLNHVTIETVWDLLHFSGLANLWNPPVTDLPSLDFTALAQIRAVAGAASNRGSRLHLSGEGGDSVVGQPGCSVIDLYRLNRRRALSSAGVMARRNGCGNVTAIREIVRIAGTTYPQELNTMGRAIRQGAPMASPIVESLSRCCRLPGAGWLTSQGAELVSSSIQTYARAQADVLPGILGDWLAARSIAANGACERREFAELGVNLEVPYLDAAVMDAGLSIPGHERTIGGGFKPLITRDLAPWLPPAITNRTTKGEYSLSVQRGADENGGYLRDLIRESQLVGGGWLNRKSIAVAIDEMIYGIEPMNASIQQFVAMEYWLRMLDTRRSSWWV